MTSPGTCGELDTPAGQRAAIARHRLRLLLRRELRGAVSRSAMGYSISFLFFSYCIGYKNATGICALGAGRKITKRKR
jgi:hypothetical protein